MKQIQLEELIFEGLSQREIASKLNISQTTVRYYLNKFQLKTDKIPLVKRTTTKLCKCCNIDKPLGDFYERNRKGNLPQNYCKTCSNKLTVTKETSMKIKLVESKGGICQHCGLKPTREQYCVFDFHHLDPSIKDRNFSSLKTWSLERALNEINTCLLLCSNCHRLEHLRLRQLK